MKFAVVDIETTGGPGAENRIMEIGIVLLDGDQVVDTYQSLIDPGTSITPFVQKLTGISDDMVSGKPQFQALAEEIAQLLEGRIFVAHNVQFDCRFVAAELKRCCIKYDPARICTVKLSRKFFPGLPSYSLHNLIESLELPDFNHHRALDDAMASAEILKLCLQKFGDEKVRKEIKNISKAPEEALA